MAVPVALLDIDGVVNVIRRGSQDKPPLHIWPESAWSTADIQAVTSEGVLETFPLLWSQAVRAFLKTLHASGAVEVRWHSSWQAQALDFAQLVGLPDWHVHPCPEYSERWGALRARQMALGKPGWWKYPAAERVLIEEQRPLIWVDDEITYEVSRLAQDEMSALGRLLIISPDPYTGLTGKHMKKIMNFIDEGEVARGALSGS